VGGGVNDSQLAAGYATAMSSQNVFGNNCNDVISAETVMMVKALHRAFWSSGTHHRHRRFGGSMQQLDCAASGL
jgi:hypothetical protein